MKHDLFHAQDLATLYYPRTGGKYAQGPSLLLYLTHPLAHPIHCPCSLCTRVARPDQHAYIRDWPYRVSMSQVTHRESWRLPCNKQKLRLSNLGIKWTQCYSLNNVETNKNTTHVTFRVTHLEFTSSVSFCPNKRR